jgi:predicted XRE-type DNA-binding protein
LTDRANYAHNGIMRIEEQEEEEGEELLKPLFWKAIKVQKSSGNLFADLGLRNPKDRLVKAALAHRIGQILADRGLTQTQAAKLMGLDRPKISALLQGKLKGFSAERLFRCLNDLGQEVEITIRPTPQVGRRGDTRVATAV